MSTGDVRVRPGELKQTRGRDWLIRFAFGAGVSALAGIVAALAGPTVGGLFLAFPAILLASLTLVAQEDGPRLARDEARGATIGTLGLLAFAAVLVVLVGRAPIWAALLAAALAWTVVAVGGYLLARRAGAGGDDDAPDGAPAGANPDPGRGRPAAAHPGRRSPAPGPAARTGRGAPPG
jgi:uncharacterized membrane protein (GlpM family)